MRIELGKYNPGTHVEVCFFLERDDQTGQLYHVQTGPRGDRRLLLNAAVGQAFYREAVDAAQALLEQSTEASFEQAPVPGP